MSIFFNRVFMPGKRLHGSQAGWVGKQLAFFRVVAQHTSLGKAKSEKRRLSLFSLFAGARTQNAAAARSDNHFSY